MSSWKEEQIKWFRKQTEVWLVCVFVFHWDTRHHWETHEEGIIWEIEVASSFRFRDIQESTKRNEDGRREKRRTSSQNEFLASRDSQRKMFPHPEYTARWLNYCRMQQKVQVRLPNQFQCVFAISFRSHFQLSIHWFVSQSLRYSSISLFLSIDISIESVCLSCMGDCTTTFPSSCLLFWHLLLKILWNGREAGRCPETLLSFRIDISSLYSLHCPLLSLLDHHHLQNASRSATLFCQAKDPKSLIASSSSLFFLLFKRLFKNDMSGKREARLFSQIFSFLIESYYCSSLFSTLMLCVVEIYLAVE